MCGRARAVFHNQSAINQVSEALNLSSRDRDTLGSVNVQNASPGCELPIYTKNTDNIRRCKWMHREKDVFEHL